MTDLISRPSLTDGQLNPFSAIEEASGDKPGITLTLYAAMDRTPAVTFRRLAPFDSSEPEKYDVPEQPRHTLILLVEE